MLLGEVVEEVAARAMVATTAKVRFATDGRVRRRDEDENEDE